MLLSHGDNIHIPFEDSTFFPELFIGILADLYYRFWNKEFDVGNSFHVMFQWCKCIESDASRSLVPQSYFELPQTA